MGEDSERKDKLCAGEAYSFPPRFGTPNDDVDWQLAANHMTSIGNESRAARGLPPLHYASQREIPRTLKN